MGWSQRCASPSSSRWLPWTSEILQNSTAYIGSWLKPLQNNPKWVLQASKQAKDAVEFVLSGKLSEERERASASATA